MNRNGLYDENELLHLVAGGDEEAFATLFEAWRDKLYFFTLRFTQSPEQSEDLVQEVFIKVWLQKEKLTTITNFSAWLYSVIRNQAISGLRRVALETSIMAQLKREAVDKGEPADESLLYKQLKQKLQIAVDQLPPRQKQIYTLTRIEGLKQGEVAQKLDLSVSTVQNHMTEALRKLRAILGRDYPTISLCVSLGFFVKEALM